MKSYNQLFEKKPEEVRVYFVNPPSPGEVKMIREGRCMQRSGVWTAIWPPYSLCMGAAILEKKGIKVKLSDCVVEEIGFKKLKKNIIDFKPNVIVINTSTPCIESDLKVAKIAKEVDENIVTLAIGIHVSEMPEDSFKMQPKLDLIIRNEIEATISELFDFKVDLKDIKGISFKDSEKAHNNPQRAFIHDLDALPFPAWNHLDFKNYTLPFYGRPFLLLATARGCPYKCTFCMAKPYYGKSLRYRSPKNVVDEMEFVVKNYNVKDFLMWTEGFTMNNDYAIEICKEIIKRDLKVGWACNSRVDTVNDELMSYIKKAGCWMVGYGVESGNQEILDHVKKGITIEQVKNAAKLTKKYGMEATAHCMVGFPGETKETVKETVKLVKDLDFDFAQFYCAVPMPWTEMYQEAEARGYITSRDWEKYEQNFSVMKTGHLEPKEVMKLRGQAYRSFYFRPKMIFRTLRRIKNLRQLKLFIFMVKDFLTWI